MVLDFLLYFIISIVAITWFYAVGYFILSAFKIRINQIQQSSLFNLLIGITAHVILFSVWKTHFATFNVILLLILLSLWWEFRKGNAGMKPTLPGFSFHLRKVMELYVIGLLLLVIKICLTVDPSIYPFFHIGRDDIFYSQMSVFISKYGKETFYIDWGANTNALGIIPYHYFELWLNSIYTGITQLISCAVYAFITFVIISLLLYQTILAVMEEVLDQAMVLKHKVVALGLIFMGDVFFGKIHSEFFPLLTGGYSLDDNLKMILLFIVFVLAWLAWRRNYYLISLVTLLIAPLLNYGFMPVIICSVPVFLIVHHWIYKTPEILPYKKIGLYYLAYIVVLIGIQKVFANQFKGPTTLSVSDLLAYYNESSKFKTLLNYLFNYVRKIVLICIPFLIILIPLRKNGMLKMGNGFNLLMLIVFVASVVLSAVLYFLIDTSQLFIISLNIVAHLFLFICIPLLLFKMERQFIYKGLFVLYLVSGAYILGSRFYHKSSRLDRYSHEFLSDVRTVSVKIHGQGIRYLTPDYYNSVYSINPNCNFEGYYLSFLKNDVTIHTVTVNHIPERQELHDFYNYNKKLILQSSYYLNYLREMHLENAPEDTAQLSFVKNNDIDFIVATKNATVPETITMLVSETITDPSSGEKLMLIDRSRLLK
jgi:hypothetical protein